MDSSCWLEVIERSPIGVKIRQVLADTEYLLVPTVVLYEVYKKLLAMRGKVYTDEFIDTMLDAEIVPLDTQLSIESVNVSRKHKLAMADSII
jgi:predicted nucleic acid-binding protein